MGNDFEVFWLMYPRKIAKAYARKFWARLTTTQQDAAIKALPNHVKYWEASGRGLEFVPHCSTWLCQERWEDELEMPEVQKPAEQWWATQAGIKAKAVELGMWPPRGGESWHELKGRITQRIAA